MEMIVQFIINRIKIIKFEYDKSTIEQIILSLIIHGTAITLFIVCLNQPIFQSIIFYSIGVILTKIFIEPKLFKFLNISK